MSATVRDAIIAADASPSRASRAVPNPAVLAAAMLALTLLSFFRFPGHTILQSDTQIYIPILEHIWDPATLSRDVMATRPHISFTLYDEAALALRVISGASFESVLMGQQFVYRFIGIAGLYFLACGLGLAPWKSLFAAAVISLGATIAGPAVLTVEYEPVPRGFALPFVIASLAAMAHSKWRLASLAATVAFGFHPPTALAYWALLSLVLAWNRRLADLAVIAIAPAIMLLTVLAAGTGPEPQPLLGRIDPALEELQRLRGSYNFVSIWLGNWWLHYLVLWIIGMAALWRIRQRISAPLMLMFAGLPLVGVLAVPVSYLLLEKAKWVLIPQFQPSRYLLFVTFVAVLLSTVAGVVAAERRRRLEAILLFTVAFAIPMDAKITNLLAPSLDSVISLKRIGLAIALAVLASFGTSWSHRAASAVLAAASVLPFILVPAIGQVRNYSALHHPELDELATWARQSTAKDALFQFADAGRELPPGVFRARAKRALYVDWKAGGQVNFHRQFSKIWSERWKLGEKPQPLDAYRAKDIDYVVFKAGAGLPSGQQPVYSNAKYVVFKLR
jgi:hypothetical protein